MGLSSPSRFKGNERFVRSHGLRAPVISVTASTWYESRKLAEGLRGRWRARLFMDRPSGVEPGRLHGRKGARDRYVSMRGLRLIEG
jgi:hypothetical protein